MYENIVQVKTDFQHYMKWKDATLLKLYTFHAVKQCNTVS